MRWNLLAGVLSIRLKGVGTIGAIAGDTIGSLDEFRPVSENTSYDVDQRYYGKEVRPPRYVSAVMKIRSQIVA